MRIDGTKDCWVGFEKSVEEEKLVDQQGWTLKKAVERNLTEFVIWIGHGSYKDGVLCTPYYESYWHGPPFQVSLMRNLQPLTNDFR
jgi:hypothetical protein